MKPAPTDGMNEGFVANLLYLAESQYPAPAKDQQAVHVDLHSGRSTRSHNFPTVTTRPRRFKRIVQHPAPTLPNGSAAALHLSLSDASGDSAIFEYVDGKLVIHHGKQYTS